MYQSGNGYQKYRLNILSSKTIIEEYVIDETTIKLVLNYYGFG